MYGGVLVRECLYDRGKNEEESLEVSLKELVGEMRPILAGGGRGGEERG